MPGGISPLISPRKVSFPSSFCCKWMEPFKAPFSSQCASSSLIDKRMKIIFKIKKEKRLPAVDDRQEACHHRRRHQHPSRDDLERNHCFLSDRLLLSTLDYATHGQRPTLVSGLQRATVGSGKSALDFRGELLFSSPRSYRAQSGGHSHPWSNTSTQKPCTPNTAYTKHSFISNVINSISNPIVHYSLFNIVTGKVHPHIQHIYHIPTTNYQIPLPCHVRPLKSHCASACWTESLLWSATCFISCDSCPFLFFTFLL